LAQARMSWLGGFTQKQITQALPKAKNNGIVKTVFSTHRHRFSPTTSCSPPRSVVVRSRKRSHGFMALSGKEGACSRSRTSRLNTLLRR